MSIEVRPVGVTCNLRCAYCYEEPVRALTPTLRYDRTAVLSAIDKSQGRWSLFGGEALLISLKDLEELLAVGFSKWKSTGVQTNGTLITPAHIDLFEKYSTHVGISLDGPGELNDSRWAGTLEATRNATAKTFRAIDMLLERADKTNNKNLVPSLIITLHGKNTSLEAWPRMKTWLNEMDSRGIMNINFHVMELDAEATEDSEWYVPHARMKEVMLDLWELSTKWVNATATNFREIVDLLRVNDKNVMCVWHACDPWNTAAVQGLEGDGSPSHCTRTNKDGIDWMPAEGFGQPAMWQIGDFPVTNRSHERQLSLYVTPQEHGGCKDCRFWVMCLGQCPGTSEESVKDEYGDWRLRTTYCQTWKDLFEEGERRLLEIGEVPISRAPQLKKIEKIMYDAWTLGQHIYLSSANDVALGKVPFENIVTTTSSSSKSVPHGDYSDHGDHTDSVMHGDLPHGDHYDNDRQNHMNNVPHGDHTDGVPHGDHVDDTSQFNIPHGDHTDEVPHGDHTDGVPHGDHTDDVPHGDHTDDVPHGDHVDDVLQFNIPHGDSPHGNLHGDHIDDVPHGDHIDDVPHGDHTDDVSHGDNQHGDSHGDSHGDHVDSAKLRSRRVEREVYKTVDGKKVTLW